MGISWPYFYLFKLIAIYKIPGFPDYDPFDLDKEKEIEMEKFVINFK